GEIGRRVGERRTYRWCCWDGGHRGCCDRVTSPDQDAARLIHGQLLTVNELFLQILDEIIVEMKFPLEDTVGDTPAMAQESQDLVKNLVEPHAYFPLCRAVPKPPHPRTAY